MKRSKTPEKSVENSGIELNIDELEPLEYLMAVVQGHIQTDNLRLRAAIAAAQYLHTRTRDGGKKEARVDAAEKVASGKYAPAAPPKLSVVNG